MKTSHVEFLYASFIESIHRDAHHSFNCLRRRRHAGSLFDVYVPSTKTGYFLNGCKVHGCFKRNKEGKLRPCRLMGYGTQLNDRNMFNETYSSVISRFESMKKRILSTCSDEVSNIVVMQECEFYSEMRKVDSPIHKFFNDKSNPLSIKSKKPKLLCPRKSLRGGSVQHFQLLADSSEGEISFVDLNALYPFIMCTKSFAVGESFHLLGKRMTSRLRYDGEKKSFVYLEDSGEETVVDGITQAVVAISPELKELSAYPFLPIRVEKKGPFFNKTY